MELVLHGCFQSAEDFLDIFAPIASANRMVMVFPQAKSCWDNFGQVSQNYLTRDGPQMQFLRNIVLNSQSKLLDPKEFDYSKQVYKARTAYNYPSDFYYRSEEGVFEFDCRAYTNESGQEAGGCETKLVEEGSKERMN